MTDDAKEWVTIKVPERVRDAAREDPRTYGELLRAGMDTEPVYGIGDEDPVESIETALAEAGDSSAMLAEIQDQLDRIERAATTAEERTGAIEKTLEEMGR